MTCNDAKKHHPKKNLQRL